MQPRYFARLPFSVGLVFFVASTLVGGDRGAVARAEQTIGEVKIEPERSTLVGRRATRQLLATLSVSAGSTRDLTRGLAWVSLDPTVAMVSPTGQVVPRGNGAATIIARVDSGTEARASIEVSGIEGSNRVSYRNDVMAAYSQASCNMGACHGTPTGKGGFRLSPARLSA